jgi:hypothetical protein
MASIFQSVAQFNPHAGGLRDDTTRFFSGDDAVTRGGETPADEFLDKIIGRRAGLRLTFSQLQAVAPTNVTVLIQPTALSSTSWLKYPIQCDILCDVT